MGEKKEEGYTDIRTHSTRVRLMRAFLTHINAPAPASLALAWCSTLSLSLSHAPPPHSWGPTGDTIIVSKIPPFSSQILPKYFKTSNFHSFVRQLNMYDFRKLHQDPTDGEFMHPYFRRGRRDLLLLIFRKGKKKGQEGQKAGES